MSEDAAGWGMLERTRALDYVTLQGLSTLTGCEATNLDALIMKELVDNGLDAARGVKPRIGVTLETGDDFLMLTVRDNGEGMLTSDIERIVDYSRLYSTKFHDRTPSRGALGNAYNILLGAPYALAAEVGASLPQWPIRIFSRSKEHRVRLVVDELKDEIKAKIDVSDSQIEDTEISITLPVYRSYWGWNQAYIDLLQGYAMFNPEADLELSLSHTQQEGSIHVRYPSVGERKRVFKGRPSIHWFSRNAVFSSSANISASFLSSTLPNNFRRLSTSSSVLSSSCLAISLSVFNSLVVILGGPFLPFISSGLRYCSMGISGKKSASATFALCRPCRAILIRNSLLPLRNSTLSSFMPSI